MIRAKTAVVAGVTRSGLSSPERPSFSTEPASAPKLVRCYHESRFRVNVKFHFGTRAAAGECSSQAPDAGASNGCEFQNSLLIHCYSLFFVAGKNCGLAFSSLGAGGGWNGPLFAAPLWIKDLFSLRRTLFCLVYLWS